MKPNNGESSPNPLFELGRAYSSSQQSTPTTNDFSASNQLSNQLSKSNRISSRQMLNNALSLANTAVNLDKDNNFPNALAAYKDAMALLESVMLRVESENKSDADHQKPTSRRLEEGRRLKIIVRFLSVTALCPTDNSQSTKLTKTELDCWKYYSTPIMLSSL